MALISLWGAPPGALLAAGGILLLLVPAVRSGRGPGLVWVTGALVALLRLLSGAGSGIPGFRPATLAGAGPLVPVAVGLLGVALFYGVALFEGRRAPVRRGVGGACLLIGGAVACLFASSLSTFLGAIVGAQVLALVLRPGGVRGWLRSGATGPLCVLVAAGSGVLLAMGWTGRRTAGGADLHDWIGTPFSGDAPSSLLFCGLALPVFLPGVAGGFTHGFLWQRHAAPQDSGAEFSPGGSGLPALCVGALLLAGLYVQFNGAEALGAWGTAAVGLALLAGGFAGWLRRGPQDGTGAAGAPPNDKRLAALVQGVTGLILVAASAASESSEAAFGYGVIATLPALGGLALAAARVAFERNRHGGIGPKGMGRIFPSTMLFCGLLSLSLAAFPWTLGFLARSQGLGALLVADGEAAGTMAAVFGAFLALLVLLPLLHGLFMSRGVPVADGQTEYGSPPRPLEGRAQRASLGLAAAFVVALGIAPDALAAVVPFASAPAQTFPSALLQASVLALAVVCFCLWTRFRSARFHAPSDGAPGYPPAP